MDRQNEEKNISEKEVVCTFIHLPMVNFDSGLTGEHYRWKPATACGSAAPKPTASTAAAG
jgi:hypothetical protein